MQNLQKNFRIENQTPFDRISYRGFLCCQTTGFWEPFYTLFEKENIDNVIDIGTCQGGTTFFVNDLVKLKCKNSYTMTVDINGFPWMNFMTEFGIDFRQDDADTEGGLLCSIIQETVQKGGKTLVICDGGSKINEVIIYSKLIKSGDIIICHDYSENREDFEKNVNGKVWNWCEITYQDISPVHHLLDRHALYHEFRNKVWGCFIKK